MRAQPAPLCDQRLASEVDPKTAQLWPATPTLTLTLDTYGHAIPSPDDHARIAAAAALLGP